jgi:hypothetical protein
MRRVVALVAVAIAGTSGCRASHAGQSNEVRYVDPAGWSLAYPSTMHREQSGARLRIDVAEVTVASFPMRRAVRSGSTPDGGWLHVDSPRDLRGHFPSTGVAFRMVTQEGGPAPDLDLPETRFPLRLARFRRSAAYETEDPRPVADRVTADGRSYLALAWIGRRASATIRAQR